MSRILKRAFQIGVLLTLLIAPTQWSLEIKPKTFLSPADIVLALTAGVWFLKTLLEKRDIKGWLKLLPPWPHLLFVAVALLSLTVAADRASAVKDGVQLIEYFIVGAMLFDAFLREGGILARRLALGVSGLAFAIILLLALFQYIRTGGVESFAVRGTFGNRNVLGGYLALSLPLLFAGIFVIRTLPIRILFGLLLVIGLQVTLSGAAYLAIAIAILGLAAHAGWKVFLPTALPLIFFQVTHVHLSLFFLDIQFATLDLVSIHHIEDGLGRVTFVYAVDLCPCIRLYDEVGIIIVLAQGNAKPVGAVLLVVVEIQTKSAPDIHDFVVGAVGAHFPEEGMGVHLNGEVAAEQFIQVALVTGVLET